MLHSWALGSSGTGIEVPFGLIRDRLLVDVVT